MHRLFPAFAAVLAAVAPTQAPGTRAPETRAAATVPADEAAAAALLAELPADASNLLVVRDALPAARALLTSEPIATLLADTAWQDALLGRSFSPRLLDQQLNLLAEFIPCEVVLAAPPQTVATFADMAIAVAAEWMLAELPADGQELAPPLRRLIEQALGNARPPALHAWLRLRSERLAERWFERLTEALAAIDDDGVTVRVDEALVELHASLDRLGGGVLPRLLNQLSIDPTPLANLDLRMQFEQRGDRLLFHTGVGKPPPLDRAALGPLWRRDATQLVFLHVDAGTALDRLAAASGPLQAAAAAVHDRSRRSDADVSLQLQQALDRLTSLPSRFAQSIVVDRGLEWVSEFYFGQDELPPVDEPAAAVVRCLDPVDGPVYLSSLPFDALLSEQLEETIGRLASRSHRLAPAQVHDWLIDNAGELREYLQGPDSAVFDPGVALVTRAAAFRGGSAFGSDVPALPFAAFALVAVGTDAPAATGFVDRLTALLADMADLPAGRLWTEADLGLGVPTRELRLRPLLPASAAAVDLDADFALHHAQDGPLTILSTDPAFTRILLQRARGADRLDLPVRRPRDWTLATGAHAAAFCDGLATLLEALVRAEGIDRRRTTRDVARNLASFIATFRTFAKAFPGIDRYEEFGEVDGTTWRNVMRFRLRGD